MSDLDFIIKIRLLNFTSVLDDIEDTKTARYRYQITDYKQGHLELTMGANDDEVLMFIHSIKLYFHIDNYDVIYGFYKYKYRKGKIGKGKLFYDKKRKV